MNHVAIIKQYLKSRQSEELVAEAYPFVTISREAGAGGHTLARDILRKLDGRFPEEFCEGWEVFDQKLCAVIAQDNSIGMTFDALVQEEYRSEATQIIHDLVAQRASRYVAYKRMFEVVRLLATLGKCVIVGRGGMCVTADMPLGVNIRLVADLKTRIRNMAQLLECSEAKAETAVHQGDKDRKRLIHDFFGKDISDPLLYDATFNAERMAIPEIADLVVDMVKQKLHRYQEARATRHGLRR